jgi:general stress protein CsbA
MRHHCTNSIILHLKVLCHICFALFLIAGILQAVFGIFPKMLRVLFSTDIADPRFIPKLLFFIILAALYLWGVYFTTCLAVDLINAWRHRKHNFNKYTEKQKKGKTEGARENRRPFLRDCQK